MKKLITADSENSNEELNKMFLFSIFFIDKNVPEAAIPNKAIETTINAKWYHCIIEKSRIREISRARVAEDIMKMPVYILLEDIIFYLRLW